jgi:predicted metal-dependent peptidase
MSKITNTVNITADRSSIDEAFVNILTNREYIRFNFYAHILAQCKTIIDLEAQFVAGVRFDTNQYILKINPKLFSKYSLRHRIGILIHESMHIVFNHSLRKGDRDHELFNFASDCALNQQIGKDFLPEDAIFPDSFEFFVPENLSAEAYYELFVKEQKEQKEVSETLKTLKTLDDHSQWSGNKENQENTENTENTENIEHQKNITKAMIQKAIGMAQGNTPYNISDILLLHTSKPKVSWRKELKSILGNRVANTRRTIMKANRRHPDRLDLKGKKKDTTFDIVTIVDVSGSMDDNDIISGLQEIYEVCKVMKSSVKILQVDTVIHGITEFKKGNKTITRNGCGGTQLYPAIEYLNTNKIPYDALIIITDSYHESLKTWTKAPKCKVMFLTNNSNIIPGIDAFPKYKQFNLQNI